MASASGVGKRLPDMALVEAWVEHMQHLGMAFALVAGMRLLGMASALASSLVGRMLILDMAFVVAFPLALA